MDKNEEYQIVLHQINAVIEGESSLIANLANTSSILKSKFDFWWVGFYFVEGDELVLGPFQGPVACTRIKIGKGVCGTAWKEKRSIVVPDVHQFPGHIACSLESNSEIVIPIFNDSGDVIAIMDVDSKEFGTFDETDQKYLEEISVVLAKCF